MTFAVRHLGGLAFPVEIVLASGAGPYNMRTAAIAAGWDQVSPLAMRVTVNSGVSIVTASTDTAAFDTGSGFPAGSQLILVNNGGIIGMGGAGGDGSGGGVNGKPGGPALRAQYPITITNGGHISGGGGGGGCCVHDNYGDIYQRQAAGGNGGSSSGSWSSGGSGTWPGASGQPEFSGAWNDYNMHPSTDGTNLWGGGGGYWGSAGGDAFGGNVSNGVGGTPGAAVIGNSNITWLATGTRRGPIT